MNINKFYFGFIFENFKNYKKVSKIKEYLNLKL